MVKTDLLDLLEWRVSALLSLTRGGETGLQEGQRSQNFQTAGLVHCSAKKAFQSSDISSQVCPSISSRIPLNISSAVHQSTAELMIPSIFMA